MTLLLSNYFNEFLELEIIFESSFFIEMIFSRSVSGLG